MKRLLTLAAILLGLPLASLIGCTDSPTESVRDGTLTRLSGDVLPPAQAIVDVEHGTGWVDGFFFLPPLAAEPTGAGEFAPEYLPHVAVSVCALDESQECVEAGIVRFTSQTGPGSETIRVDALEERFIVNWRTDAGDLHPGTDYRVEVYVAGLLVGYTDVEVVARASGLGTADTRQQVALRAGRTLPILSFIRLTGTYPEYEGSITLDQEYLDRSGIRPNEEAQVLKVENGARFTTYVTKGERGSGAVEPNGPAAHLGSVDDRIMVLAYALLHAQEIPEHEPVVLSAGVDEQ